MTDSFDRTPGAGRSRPKLGSPSPEDLGRLAEAGDGSAKPSTFSQHEPLRQPKTSLPLADGGVGSAAESRGTQSPLQGSSILSIDAPEFYPFGYTEYQEVPYEDNSEGYYQDVTLAELVQDMLSHLNASPGSFELEVEGIAATLNEWVTTEETLQELVELIYTQSTSIPNFAYTGARLCNYLSQHLAISPASGNFRQLLLRRCHTEYEQRNDAVKGDEVTQKSFHSYVLFLGELYLNLEIRGPTKRATILLEALKNLIDALLSNPVDGNIICAVKLLKLTGSVLEDDWKLNGKTEMDAVVAKIRNIQLDSTCSSRDVKAMLLNLLELRSSDWGRVVSGASAVEATPDNDPNYFMNEPTFYTDDGVPFTAADPEYSEKYQEIVDRECYCPDFSEENGTEECYEEEDGMDPEIEEAYEKFCLESERKRRQ
ncbi:polyadenylate-binding protein-interacting protein 1 [Arapaima gigas]